MKAKNIKEAKELVDRYESITLEEIEGDGRGYLNVEILTGFGSTDSCTLCQAVSHKSCIPNCGECFYEIITATLCDQGVNAESFDGICGADTPIKLRNAFRARAKHIRKLIGYEKN